jgi:hypothetical protein
MSELSRRTVLNATAAAGRGSNYELRIMNYELVVGNGACLLGLSESFARGTAPP